MITSSTFWLILGLIALALGFFSIGPEHGVFVQAVVCFGVSAILSKLEGRDV